MPRSGRWPTRRIPAAVAIDAEPGAGAFGVLSVASAVPDADRWMDLMDVIQTLPDEHRQVILLREVQGLRYREMAQVLGVPQGTVESRSRDVGPSRSISRAAVRARRSWRCSGPFPSRWGNADPRK